MDYAFNNWKSAYFVGHNFFFKIWHVIGENKVSFLYFSSKFILNYFSEKLDLRLISYCIVYILTLRDLMETAIVIFFK